MFFAPLFLASTGTSQTKGTVAIVGILGIAILVGVLGVTAIIILNFLADCPLSFSSTRRATRLFYALSKSTMNAAIKRALECYLPENRLIHSKVLVSYARDWLQIPLGPCYEFLNRGQNYDCEHCVRRPLHEPKDSIWTTMCTTKYVERSKTNGVVVLSGSSTDLIIGFSDCNCSPDNIFVTGPTKFTVQSFSQNGKYGRSGCTAIAARLLQAGDTYIYCGEFNEYRRRGIGIMRSTDGLIHYEGEWKNDKPCGVGCLLDMRRSMLYIGTMFELSLDGYGISYPILTGTGTDSFKYGYFFDAECPMFPRKPSNSICQILNRVKFMTDRLGQIADKIQLERSVFVESLREVNDYFFGIKLTLDDSTVLPSRSS